MTKIFISHSEVSLPNEAREVSVDIIHPELLKVMCADHSPILYQDLDQVWVYQDCVYAYIPEAKGEFRFYRVQATWM